MIIKLAALGALGYAGYRYLQKNSQVERDTASDRVALAGGPLSDNARVQHTAAPPATSL